jgi:hypothetical protein
VGREGWKKEEDGRIPPACVVLANGGGDIEIGGNPAPEPPALEGMENVVEYAEGDLGAWPLWWAERAREAPEVLRDSVTWGAEDPLGPSRFWSLTEPLRLGTGGR